MDRVERVELIRGLHNLRARHRACVATIGNFDGVHLGHRAVLDQLAGQAAELSVPATVVIFEPQPQEFFTHGRVPARLTRLREKLLALDCDAVDRVLCIRFDESFAALTADAFVERVLIEGLAARYVVVGDDFRFGHRRQGDFAYLRRLGERLGFQVARQESFQVDGRRVSSTAVREALEEGRLSLARSLLGYDYKLCGRVAHGDKRGRIIGFPTANIYLHRRSAPLSGVFAVRMSGVGERPRPGVANIGLRPTVRGGDRVPLLEVHLFDFEGDIYGHHVEVAFIEKIREERRFESFEALTAQIEIDARRARQVLAA